MVQLDPSFTSGKLTRTIADAQPDVPTTAAASGPFLYAVNGRFSTTPEAGTPYDIIPLPA